MQAIIYYKLTKTSHEWASLTKFISQALSLAKVKFPVVFVNYKIYLIGLTELDLSNKK